MTCLWKVYAAMNEDLNAEFIGCLVATRAYVLYLLSVNYGLVIGKGEPIEVQSN